MNKWEKDFLKYLILGNLAALTGFAVLVFVLHKMLQLL